MPYRKPRVRNGALQVVKTLWPGQPGTIKLGRRFGDTLLCVRYRHDASGLKRYTTVELLVDEGPVTGQRADKRLYAVHIRFAETELRHQAKQHGATWDPQSKHWLMCGRTVKLLRLEHRAHPLR